LIEDAGSTAAMLRERDALAMELPAVPSCAPTATA
jgi:hypothetical protein